MKQPQINNLGWILGGVGTLFLNALERTVIAKIANVEYKDVAIGIINQVRKIVAILTDSDQENTEQFKAYFAENWKELVQILGKLARLLLDAHVQTPEWVKGILVKLESGEF